MICFSEASLKRQPRRPSVIYFSAHRLSGNLDDLACAVLVVRNLPASAIERFPVGHLPAEISLYVLFFVAFSTIRVGQALALLWVLLSRMCLECLLLS